MKGSRPTWSLEGHTCDDCGAAENLHRHHEHWTPDVICVLCKECHDRWHFGRGKVGRPKFEATMGLTNKEKRGFLIRMHLEGAHPYTIRRKYTLREHAEFSDFIDSVKDAQ